MLSLSDVHCFIFMTLCLDLVFCLCLFRFWVCKAMGRGIWYFLQGHGFDPWCMHFPILLVFYTFHFLVNLYYILMGSLSLRLTTHCLVVEAFGASHKAMGLTPEHPTFYLFLLLLLPCFYTIFTFSMFCPNFLNT